MKPASERFFWGGFLAALWVLSSSGCALWSGREAEEELAAPIDVEAEEKDDRPKLVGDYTSAWGRHYLAVESVALVTGLANTGSDPPPNSQRRVLIAEMLRRDVRYPQKLLADPRTSLVVVRAFLPPGARKGDPVDIEVRTPSKSETTSLKGGWLMPTRLQEMAVMDNQIRTGNVGAVAQGNVLVNAATEGEGDPIHLLRGRVLGGGVVTRDRTLGLVIREDSRSVALSSLIGGAVNARFHVFDGGSKRGVAVPKNDEYIQLTTTKVYRDNIGRYLRVVQEVPLRLTPQAQVEWLDRLQTDLLDPETSALAALRLEAIGRDAIPTLRKGLASGDAEVRLYAAESLAYLNQADAAMALETAARSESAFRWHAITALSAMDDLAAYESLQDLMSVPSAETRYGAFRALWIRNPEDPLVKGRAMKEEFYWHEIPSTADPLLHVSTIKRPEIVAFGGPQRLERGFASLNAGRQIMIQPLTDEKIRVTRYRLDGDSEVRDIPNQLGELMQTLVALDARFSDVIEMLIEASKRKVLTGRLVFNALPKPGRAYVRGGEGQSEESADGLTTPSKDTESMGDLPQGVETGDESESDDEGSSGRGKGSVESLGEPLETLPEVAPADESGEEGDSSADESGGSAGAKSGTGTRARKASQRSRGVAPLPDLFSEPSARERRVGDRNSEWAD